MFCTVWGSFLKVKDNCFTSNNGGNKYRFTTLYSGKDLLTELISLFCFIKSMVEIEGDLVSHSDDRETGVFLLVQKYGT